jgi:hypothetical protein
MDILGNMITMTGMSEMTILPVVVFVLVVQTILIIICMTIMSKLTFKCMCCSGIIFGLAAWAIGSGSLLPVISSLSILTEPQTAWMEDEFIKEENEYNKADGRQTSYSNFDKQDMNEELYWDKLILELEKRGYDLKKKKVVQPVETKPMMTKKQTNSRINRGWLNTIKNVLNTDIWTGHTEDITTQRQSKKPLPEKEDPLQNEITKTINEDGSVTYETIFKRDQKQQKYKFPTKNIQ